MMNTTARIATPAITTTCLSILPCLPFFRYAGQRVFPWPDISNSLLIARYDHFRAPWDGHAIFGTRTRRAAGALLRIGDFSRAAFANRQSESPEHAGHPVIGRIERVVMAHQNLCHKPKHQRCGADAADRGDSQRDHEPHAVHVHQQITSAAEPGQKRRHGADVEPWQMRAGVNMPTVKM